MRTATTAAPGADMSRANLDCADKLVKRGRTVVYGGLRGSVQRVRTGRCLVLFSSYREAGRTQEWVRCSAVQVVPS